MSGPPGQYPPPVQKQSGGQYPPPVQKQSAGQHPPPGSQYPAPSAPGQYPPPGAPGQYPPPGAPGQYPPPGAPGQYPPPGAPGQYPPPGAPGQYPPPGAPGQYPPPGAPGQYPPPGAPGQYPPPGAPGQYPPPGAPGQYPPPGAPGQYPPPGAPGQYPPPGAPGQYPPPGAPGQYPPHGAPGQYPPHGAPGQFPPPGNHPGGIGPQGQDTVDSDGENYLHTRHSKHPLQVTFVNRTNQKVVLYWISERGKFKKVTKLKHGQTKDVDTFETHPFVADAKKGPNAVIDGNIAFLPQRVQGGHGTIRADITHGPNRKSLRSSPSGAPVTVKFSNRSHKTVSIKWIDVNGQPKHIKDLAPKKAWLFNSCDGHYFIACERGRDKEEMDLNCGWFYLVKQGSNHQYVKKVIITEPIDSSSSSSSSSDSD